MEIAAQFDGEVTFIGVPGLSDDEDAKAGFLDDTGANTFSTLIMGDSVWEDFGVNSQGTFVFVDDDGSFTTARRTGDLLENVEALIAR